MESTERLRPSARTSCGRRVPLTVALRWALCRSEGFIAEGWPLFSLDFFGFAADPTAGASFPKILKIYQGLE